MNNSSHSGGRELKYDDDDDDGGRKNEADCGDEAEGNDIDGHALDELSQSEGSITTRYDASQ